MANTRAKWRKLVLTGLTVCLLAMSIRQAAAFFSFGYYDAHGSIITKALTPLGVSDRNINEIIKGSKLADAKDAGGHFDDEEYHFTEESFGASTNKLKDNLNDGIDKAKECKQKQALKLFGFAFHAIHDFYSHSNWVELHITGASTPASIPIYDGLVRFNSATGKFEQGRLGTTFPTGNSAMLYIPLNPDGLNTILEFGVGGADENIVSAYFEIVPAPSGKPSHDQINKDWKESVPFFPAPQGERVAIPGQPVLYYYAFDVAQRHTEMIWNQILDAIDIQLAAEPLDAHAVKNLITKDQRNVVFCIDDTGSMTQEIGFVKTVVNNLVNQMIARDESPMLTLISFKDVPTLRGHTCLPSKFKVMVNGLSASGGGDCPEASVAAIEAGIEVAKEGVKPGDIFVATDAAAREGVAAKKAALKKAKKNKVDVISMVTGDCSISSRVIFPEFAAETGGLYFFVSNIATFPSVTELILNRTDPNNVDLLLVNDTVATGGLKDYDVPVDSTMTNATFVVSTSQIGSTHQFTLFRPNGTPVSASDPDVDAILTADTKAYQITAPTVGMWRLRVTGNGRFGASVFGVSTLSFMDFEFQRVDIVDDGDGVHPFATEITDSLIIGETIYAEARMAGDLQDAVFALRGKAGQDFEALPLGTHIDFPNIFAAEYTPTTIRNDGFFIYATGLNSAGEPYQRVFRRVFDIQSLVVEPPVGQVTVAGATIQYDFVVRNLGDTDTFQALTSTNNNFATVVNPSSFMLEENEEIIVQVSLTVPVVTTADSDELLLIVTSTTDPLVENSAGVTTTIIMNDPPVANAGADRTMECASPAGTSVTLDGSASFDPDEDPITFLWSAPGIVFDDPTSPTPSALFPHGTTTVTLAVNDGFISRLDTVRVTVQDTVAPVLTVLPCVTKLFPPNHDYVAVRVTLTAQDSCDGDLSGTIRLMSVTSDEVEDAIGQGDGATLRDIVICDTDKILLRAERQGNGDGRVYTLKYRVRDDSGNVSLASAKVVVPKCTSDCERGRGRGNGRGNPSDHANCHAVDSGVAYTVTPVVPVVTAQDPIGDTLGGFGGTQHDIIEVQAERVDDVVLMTVKFNGPVDPADEFSPNSIGGIIDFDIDQNAATGFPSFIDFFSPYGSADLGVEFSVDLFSVFDGFAPTFPGFIPLPITFADTSFTLEIPLMMLGDNGDFNTGLLVGSFFDLTDLAPNGGHIEVLLENTVIPEDPLCAIYFNDCPKFGHGHDQCGCGEPSQELLAGINTATLLGAGAIQGILNDEHPAYAEVVIASLSHPEYQLTVTADENGRFVFPEVNTLGLFSLVAYHDGEMIIRYLFLHLGENELLDLGVIHSEPENTPPNMSWEHEEEGH